LCDQHKADARFHDERTGKRNRRTLVAIRIKLLMNKGKRGILERGLQRRLSGGPRARRKDWSGATEEISEPEIGDHEVTANESLIRTEGLVYAALRVWELKHGFRD
jgi:hypothetical protein